MAGAGGGLVSVWFATGLDQGNLLQAFDVDAPRERDTRHAFQITIPAEI